VPSRVTTPPSRARSVGVGLRHPGDVDALDAPELATGDHIMKGAEARQLGEFEIDRGCACRGAAGEHLGGLGAARQGLLGEYGEAAIEGEASRRLGERRRQRQRDGVEILGE
jgi:hypothetical protein